MDNATLTYAQAAFALMATLTMEQALAIAGQKTAKEFSPPAVEQARLATLAMMASWGGL